MIATREVLRRRRRLTLRAPGLRILLSLVLKLNSLFLTMYATTTAQTVRSTVWIASKGFGIVGAKNSQTWGTSFDTRKDISLCHQLILYRTSGMRCVWNS